MIAYVVVCFLLIQFLALWIAIRFFWKRYDQSKFIDPKVSILIAARNEETQLPRLLESLKTLDYPKELLEILIVDDASQDQTQSILYDWKKESERHQVLTLSEADFGKLHPNGKANALAQLVMQATGDFFFFTDADCQVPRDWIKAGLSAFTDSKTGLVLGITAVHGNRFLDRMQAMDWWNTLGLVKISTDLGFPATGLGNNMVVSREAYFQSGGFPNTANSLTEDLELARLIRKIGFKIRYQFTQNMLVKTKSEGSFRALMQQRKRWMQGVMSLSIPWKIALGLQFAYFPALVYLIFHWPIVGYGIWMGKSLIQWSLNRILAGRAGQKMRFTDGLLYDFYQFLTLTLTILYYFWPQKTPWKSRKYP
ncbi:glycosyltransferase [Algoriphagus sanaruensis]|uniref:Glycosyltransferase 2-like domain-containing protein n=1 Tax=Algoriphagus sanaruensis TaxID=1727163 RepID=A0A142ES62_9BACT|nr:glycosyltransferase [Algoriphagus sanaruensis]AMQ57967.1 hypothetical protein AO498_16055 [Algoriphagus sanaruensis]